MLSFNFLCRQSQLNFASVSESPYQQKQSEKHKEIALELEQAVEFAENSPDPDPDHIFDGLYA